MKLEEYKKKRNKKLVLPSGLEIEVRNLSPYTLLKIQENLKIDVSNKDGYTSELIDRLFEAYLVKPKISKEIKISEFEKEDYEKLHELIFEEVTFAEEEK